MSDTRSPIERLFDSADFRCTTCGTPGMGNCDCQKKCSCGYWVAKGEKCRNPNTERCSLKMRVA